MDDHMQVFINLYSVHKYHIHDKYMNRSYGEFEFKKMEKTKDSKLHVYILSRDRAFNMNVLIEHVCYLLTVYILLIVVTWIANIIIFF